MRTIYRLANSEKDLAACEAFAKELGVVHGKLGFPTVLGENNGKVVCFLSTRPSKVRVLAEPLVFRRTKCINNAKLFINIIEAYERVLIMAGVRQYIFRLQAENINWIKAIKAYTGMTPYGIVEGCAWYRRDI